MKTRLIVIVVCLLATLALLALPVAATAPQPLDSPIPTPTLNPLFPTTTPAPDQQVTAALVQDAPAHRAVLRSEPVTPETLPETGDRAGRYILRDIGIGVIVVIVLYMLSAWFDRAPKQKETHDQEGIEQTR